MTLFQSNPISLPHRPTCIVWYAGDPCDEMQQQYNQVVLEHQQQEWDTSVAAPLRKQIRDQQRQIAEQQTQIRTLRLTMELQSSAVLHTQARSRAAIELLGALLGIGMALFVALSTFRRLATKANLREKRPVPA